MPIDTSIIGRLQPFQMQQRDPFEQAGKQIQLMELLRKQKLAQQEEGAMAADMPRFVQLLKGTPAQSMDMGQIDPSMSQFGSLETAPAVAPNPAQAYGFAMASRAPQLQQLGAKGFAEMPGLEAKAQEAKDMRAWRADESRAASERAKEAKAEQMAAAHQQKMEFLAANNASREQMAAAQREHQIALKQLGASLAGAMRQPEAPVAVIGPDGKPVYVSRTNALGMTPATGTEKPMTPQQEAKYRTQIAKDYSEVGALLQNTQDVLDSASAVKGSKGLGGATGLQAYVPSFPDSEAAKAEVRLKNLEGKVTNMGKTAAAASGALGSMAVAEWKIVRDMVAAIEPKKGEKALTEQIELVENAARGAAERLRDAYQKQYGADFERYPQFRDLQEPKSAKGGAPASKPGGPKPGTVDNGYRFKGGNPADKSNWEKM